MDFLLRASLCENCPKLNVLFPDPHQINCDHPQEMWTHVEHILINVIGFSQLIAIQPLLQQSISAITEPETALTKQPSGVRPHKMIICLVGTMAPETLASVVPPMAVHWHLQLQ